MFFKFGRKKSTKTQDDHAIINSGHEHKELLTDKEVLEYFAPYADLSALPIPSLAEEADYECHAQTDMVYSDEDQKEQEARILAGKDAEEERLRLIKESEEEKTRRAEEAERKRKERERKKNIFLNSYNKGLDNLSGELFGSDGTGIFNKGKYFLYQNDTNGNPLALEYKNSDGVSQYEYDYYLLEISWQDGVDFSKYTKETDLVYVVVNAKQPKPVEK